MLYSKKLAAKFANSFRLPNICVSLIVWVVVGLLSEWCYSLLSEAVPSVELPADTSKRHGHCSEIQNQRNRE